MNEPDMNEPDLDQQSPPGLGSCDALTAEWVSVLVNTGGGGTSSAGLAEILSPLAESLLATAREVPFQPRHAEQAGAGLVAAGLIGADTLGRSLTVIGRHVAPGGTPASAVAEAFRRRVRRRPGRLPLPARSADRAG